MKAFGEGVIANLLSPLDGSSDKFRDYVLLKVENLSSSGLSKVLANNSIAGGATYQFPGTLHRARAADRPWEIRWWTMDGPQVASMIAGFGFERNGIHQAGPVPQELFDRLRLALEDVSLAGEARGAAAAYELLAAASAHAKYVDPSPVVDAARHIIESQWHDPSLDINALARQLRTHRSNLSRLFSARHGVSPSQYLVRMRLSHALSLLKQTNLPVKEISFRCGFSNPNYFARFFRRTQHMTPLGWRKH
jgi:AraC-like DNA-binding protein